MDFFRALISAGSASVQTATPQKVEENSARYCPGGYHPVAIGDLYKGRYQVRWKLGFGRYSTVWLARDLCDNQHVALKILTADSYGPQKSVYELAILQHISMVDSSHAGYKHVIHLLDHFEHIGPNGNHLCLVFKVMGESVRALRRRFVTRQLPAILMKQIARQVLLGLDYLHNSCGVIHTDVKPENILVEVDGVESVVQSHLENSPEDRDIHVPTCHLRSEALVAKTADSMATVNVRIADFGVASWVDDHLTEWIQPPALRAPEVILGIPWDSKVDVWSAACSIFELLQGYVVFSGKQHESGAWTAEEDHLAQMIELLGPIPSDVLAQGSRSSQYFDEDGRMRNIHHFYPITFEEKIKVKKNKDLSENDVVALSSFLQSMLHYRSHDRKDAGAAAADPWLRRPEERSNSWMKVCV